MNAPSPRYNMEDAPIREVWFSGSVAVHKGYLFCWDRDNASAYGLSAPGSTLFTSASWNPNRFNWVEQPSSGNLHNFAGVADKEYPAVAGGQFIKILVPRNHSVQVYMTRNVTATYELVCVQPGSFAGGAIGTGVPIGVTAQIVDKSGTAGCVQCTLDMPNWEHLCYGSIAGAGPSLAIWETCPWELINNCPQLGATFWSDFKNNYHLIANQTATMLSDGIMGWTGATAGTLDSDTALPDGALKLFTTTDNEETGIQAWGGGNVAGNAIFNTSRRLWMEARIKVSNITDSKFGLFLGFAEKALGSTGGIIANTGSLTDKDLVGFHRLEGDGDKMDLVHNTAGGGGVTTLLADAVTLVADTWVKLGIFCDGTRVYFYKDGVVIGTSVLLAAANFPGGKAMAWYLAQMAAHADDATTHIDWLRIAMLR